MKSISHTAFIFSIFFFARPMMAYPIIPVMMPYMIILMHIITTHMYPGQATVWHSAAPTTF